MTDSFTATTVDGTSQLVTITINGANDAAVITVSFGNWTDGTHTPSVNQSVDGTTYTPCGTADLDGTARFYAELFGLERRDAPPPLTRIAAA